MILKFLKNTNSYLIVFLMISLMLFFLPNLIMINYSLSIKTTALNLFEMFLIMTIIFFNSMGLNNLIYEQDVIKKPSIILSFVFVILNTIFFDKYKLDIAVIAVSASFLLLFFLKYLLTLFKTKKPYKNVFNSVLLISGMSVAASQFLILILLVFFATIIFRNFEWRLLFISLIASIIPYLFIWTYQYISYQNFYSPNFAIENSLGHLNLDTLHAQLWLITFCLVIVFSIIEIFNWIYKKSIKSRESFFIIIMYLVITIFLAIFFNNMIFLYLSIAPLSIVISNFFTYYRLTIISEILFILLFFSTVFYRISIINM